VTTPLDIEVRPEGDTVTLVLEGELDLTSAASLQACLDEIDANWAVVAVDVTGLSFIDSSGVATLIKAHYRLDAVGSTLEVRSPRDVVRQVLELTGADALFKIA
jgi:anti-anti-sigma factor